MPKGIYFGVNGVARKVNKLYIGIDTKARKVKKMYFGVDGKARICYSAGINYVGNLNTSNMAGGRVYRGTGCTSIGDNLLVGELTWMDTFNKSLVRGSTTPLGVSRIYLTSDSNSKYALFAGGRDDSNSKSNVDIYDLGLVRTSTYLANMVNRHAMGSGCISDKVLFAGGVSYGTGNYYDQIDIFDSSLTRATSTLLRRVAWSIGLRTTNHLLFACGYNYDYSYYGLITSAFDSSLVRTQPTDIDFTGTESTGASNSNYAIYMRGGNVVAYNSSLVLSKPPSLPATIYTQGTLSFNDMAVFAGGFLVGGVKQKTVYAYDKNLVISTLPDLSVARYDMASGKLGSYGFLIGSDNPKSTTIDVYSE